ncbi:MAG TPA: hypothetical protein VK548_29170 [Candidatus Acidoferrum sp.]|nr:hypothetical protein [Candidatus Acidoferrum sp.]
MAEEIGIVPIRSMLIDLDERGFELSATLLYWGRDPSWLPYHHEFLALTRRCPGLAYHPMVAAGDAGRLAARADALVSDTRDLVAYVSGGGAMIDAVREVLMARGLDRKSVRWEKFW